MKERSRNKKHIMEFLKGFVVVFIADYISTYIVFRSTPFQVLIHIVLAGIIGGILNYIIHKYKMKLFQLCSS